MHRKDLLGSLRHKRQESWRQTLLGFDLVIVVELVPGLLQDVSETDLLLRWAGAS